MSWSYIKVGRSSKLLEVVKQQFADTHSGAPKDSAEEIAKNSLGEIARVLCNSFAGDPVVRIEASGSAWNDGGNAHSHTVSFKFETIGDFVE